jgi:ribosomal protein L40E
VRSRETATRCREFARCVSRSLRNPSRIAE